ncbi:hypothetical protein D3C75_1077990 [compost metagenome]
MAKQERTATQCIGEHRRPGFIINFTRFFCEATVVVEHIARFAVLSVRLTVKIPQIRFEGLVIADTETMHQP